MDDAFERRLRAAVSAGWRVLIIEVGALTIAWVVYLWLASAQPRALLPFFGPHATWADVAGVSLLAIAVFKIAVWLQAGLLAWGTLWASMLRRQGGTNP